MHATHRDELFNPEPSRFDAFRFCRPCEAYEAWEKTAETGKVDSSFPSGDQTKSMTNTVRSAAKVNESHSSPGVEVPNQLSTVTGGDTFLSFGHGKYACPGRFFASHEIKLMLAQLVQHYDVAFMAKRPANQVIMEVMLASRSTQIRSLESDILTLLIGGR